MSLGCLSCSEGDIVDGREEENTIKENDRINDDDDNEENGDVGVSVSQDKDDGVNKSSERHRHIPIAHSVDQEKTINGEKLFRLGLFGRLSAAFFGCENSLEVNPPLAGALPPARITLWILDIQFYLFRPVLQCN